MHRSGRFCYLLSLAIYCATATLAWADAQRSTIVVFDAELVDTSLEGEMSGQNPADSKRLSMITEQLREGFHSSDQFTLVDTDAALQSLADLRKTVHFLHDCNNCELDIAKSLGAEQSAVIWVQKVSNLILNLNVVIKEVATGNTVRTAFVDIRGNTDRSWQHGMRYMLKYRLLGTGKPSAP
jgi:hypothetical protein